MLSGARPMMIGCTAVGFEPVAAEQASEVAIAAAPIKAAAKLRAFIIRRVCMTVKRESLPALTQSVEQVHCDACARGGERMTQCDCSAMYVQLLARDLQLEFDSACLGRERLVDLDHIHLIERHVRLEKCGFDSGNRADSHNARINTGQSPRYEPSDRLEAVALRILTARDYHCAGAVAQSRSIACGDYTVLLEYGA